MDNNIYAWKNKYGVCVCVGVYNTLYGPSVLTLVQHIRVFYVFNKNLNKLKSQKGSF